LYESGLHDDSVLAFPSTVDEAQRSDGGRALVDPVDVLKVQSEKSIEMAIETRAPLIHVPLPQRANAEVAQPALDSPEEPQQQRNA